MFKFGDCIVRLQRRLLYGPTLYGLTLAVVSILKWMIRIRDLQRKILSENRTITESLLQIICLSALVPCPLWGGGGGELLTKRSTSFISPYYQAVYYKENCSYYIFHFVLWNCNKEFMKFLIVVLSTSVCWFLILRNCLMWFSDSKKTRVHTCCGNRK